MNLFTLLKKDQVHLQPKTKVVSAEDFSKLVSADQIVTQTQEEEPVYRSEVAHECEKLKELAEAAGFEEGMRQWSEQIKFLENEIKKVRQEMEHSIVPLALTAVKKMIGKELEIKPETVVDIVATALKTVSQHRRVSIYVNKFDLDYVEAQRSRLKALFEHLESLAIAVREDIPQGGCIIETEAGIINAKLENQLKMLEAAFQSFFQSRKKE